MRQPVSTSRRARALAIFAVAGIAIAACGGDDDAADADTEARRSAVVDDGSAPTASSVEPVHGGTLVVGVSADTANPWTPADMICTNACFHTIRGTVYESVVMTGADGAVYPYLLESIEPNNDFTVWTLVARDGITFHDGTPLDGAAIAYNLQKNVASPQLGLAVTPIKKIAHDGKMTVTVTLDKSWPAFPSYLPSQIGFVASPTWLRAVEAGNADPTKPVGTGPFVVESYESGESGRLRTTRFEDYWRGEGPNATGEGLPYLDAVEVRFMPDGEARSRAVVAGDVDLIVTDTGSEIARLQEESGVEMLAMDSPGSTATFHLLINNAAKVGDKENPFADERVRRALAMATDKEQLSVVGTGGVFETANGAFPPGRPGHLADTGAPSYDPDAARALLEEVLAETGASSIPISLKTATGAQNVTLSELLEAMWEDVGFTVSIDQIPEGEFFGEAIAGNFEVFTFSSHAGFDPDQQYIWWSSETQGEGLSLNLGRVFEPEVDQLLETIRSESDDAAQTAAAEDLNRFFADHVSFVPLWWEYPYQVFNERVHNVGLMRPPGDDEPVAIEAPVTPIEIFKTG